MGPQNGSMGNLNCIFCKRDSSGSVSEEHIIPESLWNTKQLLRPGIVCDQCNNYFSREVERPFLELPEILSMRFEEGIPSKRNKIPPVKGIIFPDAPVLVHRDGKQNHAPITIDVPPIFFNKLNSLNKVELVIPMAKEPPANKTTTRFLAKVALEAMAQRVENNQRMLNFLVNDPQLDALRDHARRGTTDSWEILIRRIYPAERRGYDSNGQEYQVVHEYDFLLTKQSEMYFVFALFGIELAINIGGPYVDGYRLWLEENQEVSPLYFGKNKDSRFE